VVCGTVGGRNFHIFYRVFNQTAALYRAVVSSRIGVGGVVLGAALKDPSTAGIRGSIHAVTGVGYLLAIGFASLPWLYGKFAGKLVKEFPTAVQFDLGIGPYLAAAVLLIGMGLVGYFDSIRQDVTQPLV